MRKVVSILSMVFFLAMSSTIALADVVPGAALYLDASDNPAHPDAWTNLGTAGGELPVGDATPVLEDGTIEIPGLGFVLPDTKFYTGQESLQTFGGPVGTNPEVPVSDWTFEALCKRNGDVIHEEHWMFCFAPDLWQPIAGFLGEGRQAGGELFIVGPSGQQPHGIDLLLDEWTWIAMTGDANETIFYQDGQELHRDEGLTFDAPLQSIAMFTSHYPERRRSFNGSFAIVRIYDRVLSAGEIMGNIQGTASAVDPAAKLTTTWGREKTRY